MGTPQPPFEHTGDQPPRVVEGDINAYDPDEVPTIRGPKDRDPRAPELRPSDKPWAPEYED